MLGHLSASQITRLKTLQKELRAVSAADVSVGSSASAAAALPGSGYGAAAAASRADDPASAAATLQAELDEIVASECLFCGQVMIDSVGAPFVDDDGDATSHEWDL
jgi:hypothetical protein